MSTLQISLAVIGVILLGLIVAYNAWSNRRNAPKRPDQTSHEQRSEASDSRFDPGLDGVDVTNLPPMQHEVEVDPLLGASPAEASVLSASEPSELAAESLQAPVVSEHEAEGGRQEPSLSPSVASSSSSAERKLALDALIDAIAPIRIDGVLTGERVLACQPTTRRAGSKQFRIEGLNEVSGQWESARVGHRYTAFQAGVQLANRLGALNDIEYSEFVAKVQTFADSINGLVDLPDMMHEVSRARELDQFAGEHDAQLSFLLRPRRAAWSPGYIEQHAAALGFVHGAMPGRLQLPSSVAGHAPLLTLTYDAQAAQASNLDQTAVHELWLSLDVPQVPRSEEPFEKLREVVQALCENMEGMLCDQNGRQLLPQVFDPIQADLDKLYDKLDSRELSAGSMLARRLFN